LRGSVLQRGEAVQILREISKCILDESSVSCVFLEQADNSRDCRKIDYELHLIMRVDETTRKNIETLVKKHGLSVKVSNEDFIVYALQSQMEIVA